MDFVYITDFSLPIMRTLPAKLAAGNVPVTLHSLDQLIQTHRTRPQQVCPLLSQGHGAHHHDDSHTAHHGNDTNGAHEDQDSHGGINADSHEEEKGHSSHDIHKRSCKESPEESRLVGDFQTEALSYYTLAREYPDTFASQGNRLRTRPKGR